MAVAGMPKSLRAAVVTLCFVLLAAVGGAAPAQGAPTTGLWLDPDTAQLLSGDKVMLALWVDEVEALYRVELHLAYDAAGLEVQDADLRRAGVQIEPGPVFCESCTAWNEAIGGEIHFVAQRDPFDESFSGSGIVATITLLVTATEPGTYTVSFDRADCLLLDRDGNPIPVSRFGDTTLLVPAPVVTLTGWLTREGWGDDGRSAINAVLYPPASPYEPASWGRACTDAAGDFRLEIAANPESPPSSILPADSPPSSPLCPSWWAFVRLDFTNYLSECYWECAEGGVWDIGWHDLEGGDVDGDGCVNILDIVGIVGQYGETAETPCYIPCEACPPDSPPPHVAPARDINGDCQVNILDLAQAAGNFGLCSNCP